jgi:hypothetical protein
VLQGRVPRQVTRARRSPWCVRVGGGEGREGGGGGGCCLCVWERRGGEGGREREKERGARND